MRVFLHKLDGPYDSLLFQQFLKIIQEGRIMFIEELLGPQVLIGRDHDIIQIAIGDFQVIEIANVALGGNLVPDSNIGDCGQLALLHEAQLLRVVVAPLQRPALLLLKLEHASALRVHLQDV
jgi:hypothetical protein